jgi:hypothetical protein
MNNYSLYRKEAERLQPAWIGPSVNWRPEAEIVEKWMPGP